MGLLDVDWLFLRNKNFLLENFVTRVCRLHRRYVLIFEFWAANKLINKRRSAGSVDRVLSNVTMKLFGNWDSFLGCTWWGKALRPRPPRQCPTARWGITGSIHRVITRNQRDSGGCRNTDSGLVRIGRVGGFRLRRSF